MRLEAQAHTLLAPAPPGSELDILAALAPGKGSRYLLDKGWRSYGTWQSLLSHLLNFILPDQRLCSVKNMCVHIQISDCIQIVYVLPFLQIDTASEIF